MLKSNVIATGLLLLLLTVITSAINSVKIKIRQTIQRFNILVFRVP